MSYVTVTITFIICNRYEEFLCMILIVTSTNRDTLDTSIVDQFCANHCSICCFSQEEILKDLSALMDNSRTEFPRLYFLSNQELVELLSISRNPQGFLPFAQRCFPGIVALNYALPSEMTMTQGSDNRGFLDFHLNGQ